MLRSLPPRFKVDVKIAPGTHASEEAVNKQVWRRFYSSSNPKLLEGTSGKLLDLNNGPIWDYGVPN